ncbi:MAG: Rhodanese protein [Anaerolineales bacterium]|nr:Rhodanese protein [Anaerolineales bacterium]
MHGTRVSAGKEKGHATAPFLVHEIPGIGIGDCRVALRGRAEYAAGTIPAAESILAGEVGQASRGHRLRYYDHNTRIVVFGNSASEARVKVGSGTEVRISGIETRQVF